MKRILLCGLLFVPTVLLPLAQAGKKGDDAKDPKEALQALQEYIGGWKGAGTSEKNKSDIWKETADWSWRFKGKDVYLTVSMATSKLFKTAEVRYLPDTGKYQLTLIDKKDGKSVYEGGLKKNLLTLERKNDNGGIEQHKLNIVAGGDRLVHDFYIKPADRTQFNKQYQIGYTREGVTFGAAAGEKKPECVVTGGLGTMQVSYMGQTYYVCCTGCRDAFNENPAKIIAEYKKRKAAGQ
jgi:YHS domain-containing protein